MPQRTVRTPPRLALPTTLLAVVTALSSLSSAHAAPAKVGYDFAPIPSWVAPVRVPSARLDAPDSDGTFWFLLIDDQQRLGPRGELSRFFHGARHFPNPSAVENASQLRITFDPSYERLILHGVWRWRDGRREDVFDRRSVQFLQRERGLDSNLLDGRQTATILTANLLAGDSLEYAYTLSGSNPAQGEHFTHTLSPDYGFHVARWHQRLLFPADRTIHVRRNRTSLDFAETRIDGFREWIWEAEDLVSEPYDDEVPVSFDPTPWIQLSSWSSWAEVSSWGRAHFATSARAKGAVQEEARRITRDHQTPAARLRAALTFVQREVRYLGLEMGSHAYRPYPPEVVLARRFGDCKDKSLLLVTLLEALRIDAAPALVNTQAGLAMDGWHPSHAVFDHVIVHARLEDAEYWLDPTRAEERGALEQLVPPAFGRALLLRPETKALVEIPRPPLTEPSVESEEHYVATTFDAPVALTVTTLYRGDSASGLRERFRNSRAKQIARDYLNFYARSDPEIRASAELEIADDADRNVFTTIERYELPRFNQKERREFDAHLVTPELRTPRIRQRKTPYGIQHPVHIVQRFVIDKTERSNLEAGKGTIAGPAAEFQWRAAEEGTRVTFEYRFRTLADSVAPEKLAKHLEFVDEVQNHASSWIRLGPSLLPIPEPGVTGDPLAIAFGVSLLGMALFLGPLRSRGRRNRQRNTAPPPV